MDFERRKERSEEPEFSSLNVREERRGSSVGPILERPKYLRLSSRLKNESSSLPRVSNFPRIPKLSLPNSSVPTTPTDSWQENLFRKREFMSSSSSVEEVTGRPTGALKKKTRSRLSLNLGVFDSVTSPSTPVRSPG